MAGGASATGAARLCGTKLSLISILLMRDGLWLLGHVMLSRTGDISRVWEILKVSKCTWDIKITTQFLLSVAMELSRLQELATIINTHYLLETYFKFKI